MSENCIICDEKYNKLKHKPICCLYCDFTACRTCCETFIVNERTAKCMDRNCDKEWTRKFMVDNFTIAFRKGKWTNVIEDVEFDNEQALLPATQIVVEGMREKERIQREIDNVDQLIWQLRRRRRALEVEYSSNTTTNNSKERRHFVRACPEENCRGFLSSAWKCGLCDKYTCPDCHVVKGSRNDAEHVCKTEDLETAKLLDKDTKPCPKCGTGIFKIDGCDQMWCTQCHTAFSWRTGRIETHIHNPHFYEWQRRSNGGTAPRNIGDMVCGRELEQHTARAMVELFIHRFDFDDDDLEHTNAHVNQSFMHSESKWCIDNITLIIQSVIHLQRVQMHNYQVNHVEDNQDLRVQYLRNIITKEQFKTKVHRANKDHSKKREIGNILHLFVQTTTDIMYRTIEFLRHSGMCDTYEKKTLFLQNTKEHLQEVVAILEYANECLMHIAQAYSCTRKIIVLYTYNNHRRIVNRDVLRTWRKPTEPM